jgi:hypothetical protein
METRYRLKANEENFRVVDGPFANRQYHLDRTYAPADIPPEEARRFEQVPDPPDGSMEHGAESKEQGQQKQQGARSMEQGAGAAPEPPPPPPTPETKATGQEAPGAEQGA